MNIDVHLDIAIPPECVVMTKKLKSRRVSWIIGVGVGIGTGSSVRVLQYGQQTTR